METINGVGTCVVCVSNKTNSVYLCGHACCCLDCARRIGPKCPYCRKDYDFIELFNVTDVDIPEVIQTLETKIKESLETLQLQELNFREKMEDFKTEMEDFKTKKEKEIAMLSHELFVVKEEQLKTYKLRMEDLQAENAYLTKSNTSLEQKLSEHLSTIATLKMELTKPKAGTFMPILKKDVDSMQKENEKFITTYFSDNQRLVDTLITRICTSGKYYKKTQPEAVNFRDSDTVFIIGRMKRTAYYLSGARACYDYVDMCIFGQYSGGKIYPHTHTIYCKNPEYKIRPEDKEPILLVPGMHIWKQLDYIKTASGDFKCRV